MSIELLKKLPTPTEIKADYPVTQKVARIKEERDEMIRKVFTGESDKFLVIIGPCSADNEEAVCEYINRLSRVQEEVADKLILIPRIYTNKPRTTGEGYKGILHQPDPEKKPDLKRIREKKNPVRKKSSSERKRRRTRKTRRSRN